MHSGQYLHFLGLTVNIAALYSLVATVVIITAICIWSTRHISVDNPGKPQLFMEWLIDFVQGVVGGTIHNKHAEGYQVLGLTLMLFIFISNIIGLPFLVEFGEVHYWMSPTADPVITFALAMTVILLSHFNGIEHKGFKRYLVETYLHPVGLFLPINLVEELTNTLTLALRLYGNIFAGEVLLGLIASAGMALAPVSWIVGIPLQIIWQGFSLFIGGIQAYIFVTLTMVYLSNKVD